MLLFPAFEFLQIRSLRAQLADYANGNAAGGQALTKQLSGLEHHVDSEIAKQNLVIQNQLGDIRQDLEALKVRVKTLEGKKR